MRKQVPRDWLSTDQVLAAVADSPEVEGGVSRRSLNTWARSGRISRPRKATSPGGRGHANYYPPEVVGQVIAIKKTEHRTSGPRYADRADRVIDWTAQGDRPFEGLWVFKESVKARDEIDEWDEASYFRALVVGEAASIDTEKQFLRSVWDAATEDVLAEARALLARGVSPTLLLTVSKKTVLPDFMFTGTGQVISLERVVPRLHKLCDLPPPPEPKFRSAARVVDDKGAEHAVLVEGGRWRLVGLAEGDRR